MLPPYVNYNRRVILNSKVNLSGKGKNNSIIFTRPHRTRPGRNQSELTFLNQSDLNPCFTTSRAKFIWSAVGRHLPKSTIPFRHP